MLKLNCLFIGIAIAYLAYTINYSLDITKDLSLHGNSSCSKIPLPLPTEDLAVYGKYIIGVIADIINLPVKDQSAFKASPGSLIAINSEIGSLHHIKFLNFLEEYQINANGIILFNNETL